jgi:hypothetical protein
MLPIQKNKERATHIYFSSGLRTIITSFHN